jgi:hypothetical protein
MRPSVSPAECPVIKLRLITLVFADTVFSPITAAICLPFHYSPYLDLKYNPESQQLPFACKVSAQQIISPFTPTIPVASVYKD